MRKYEVKFFNGNEVVEKTCYEQEICCLGAIANHLEFIVDIGLADRIVADCKEHGFNGRPWHWEYPFEDEDEDEEDDS